MDAIRSLFCPSWPFTAQAAERKYDSGSVLTSQQSGYSRILLPILTASVSVAAIAAVGCITASLSTSIFLLSLAPLAATALVLGACYLYHSVSSVEHPVMMEDLETPVVIDQVEGEEDRANLWVEISALVGNARAPRELKKESLEEALGLLRTAYKRGYILCGEDQFQDLSELLKRVWSDREGFRKHINEIMTLLNALGWGEDSRIATLICANNPGEDLGLYIQEAKDYIDNASGLTPEESETLTKCLRPLKSAYIECRKECPSNKFPDLLKFIYFMETHKKSPNIA